jgi:perosamine synthetase
MFTWPIVTAEDEGAVIEVLRSGRMSGTEITKVFEQEIAHWMGARHALAHPNGTAAIKAAFWACGVGAGDEVICPSMTYWASALPALTLGAAVHFADIDAATLCIDPADIEHRISERTRAIMVVHYAGHPCEMDEIMRIARKHGIKVVEDASHAQGSLYRGRMCGTIGDIGAFSMMSGKSLSIGEGGMIVTDDRYLYERCVAYGHYERTGLKTRWNPPDDQITFPDLAEYRGLPLGGYKNRLNQTCAAMGRVQLRHYPGRIAEIQRAMNRFWDALEGVPGVRAHRVAGGSGSTMGGWYFPQGLYVPGELGGLSLESFCAEVRAQGWTGCYPGANFPLHLHPVFHTADLFHQGRPTMIAFGQRDVRQGRGTLPAAERIDETCFSVPWFKHDRPYRIGEYVEAFKRVALAHARHVA